MSNLLAVLCVVVAVASLVTAAWVVIQTRGEYRRGFEQGLSVGLHLGGRRGNGMESGMMSALLPMILEALKAGETTGKDEPTGSETLKTTMV